jgi:hypothetical protein
MTGADWDEMDRQAGRVIRPRLETLGISFSDEELRFHRNIGRGRSVRLNCLAQIDQAETWLMSILHTNRARAFYDEEALAAVIGTVWFRVCVNSSQLGYPLLDRYRRSRIFRGRDDYPRLLTLAGSVMKRSILSRNTAGK